jgi:hypothetical protein
MPEATRRFSAALQPSTKNLFEKGPVMLTVMRITLATAIFLTAPVRALASEPVQFGGELLIGGKDLVDPQPDQHTDTYAYITVTGSAALSIYDAMAAGEEVDLCLGEGWSLKRSGGLSCSIRKGAAEASCHFSVRLDGAHLGTGLPC